MRKRRTSVVEDYFDFAEEATASVEMKTVAVATCLLLAAAIVHADYIDVYLEETMDQFTPCAKENGLTGDSPREMFDRDTNLGVDGASCYRGCILRALNMLSDSKINVEETNKFIQRVYADKPELMKTLQKVSEDCIAEVDDVKDECKKAFSYIQCYLDKH